MSTKEKPFDLMAAMKEGQCYTRDGRSVMLVCVLCDDSTYPVQGVILDGAEMRQVNWTLEGRFLKSEPNHPATLVNEKPEIEDED